MGYALIPLLVLSVAFSLTVNAQRETLRVLGPDSRADAAAEMRALQAEVFAAACVAAAQAQIGVASDGIAVAWPAGMVALAGATCATRTDGTGRLVYAGVPTLPGVAGVMLDRLNGSALWSTVRVAGTAQPLVGGQPTTVPTLFAAGTLIYQSRVAK